MLPFVKEAVISLLKQKQFSEYFEAAIQWLIDRDLCNVTVLPTKGRFWAEIDFVEDFEKASQEMPNALVQLAAGKVVYE